MFRLRAGLSTARRMGHRLVKVVHGYGSTGAGGAIKQAGHLFLQKELQAGRIKAWCPGEFLGAQSNRALPLLQADPKLRSDSDWGRMNDGISVVLLR